mgnify:CR=1 FL=1
MKKTILLILAALILMTGCSAGSAVDMNTLKDSMLGAAQGLPEMREVTDKSEGAEQLFTYLSDMDYSKVAEFFFEYSNSGSPEELAVIRVKNASDVQSAADSLKSHAKGRTALYKQYSPEDAALPENAIIFTKNDAAVMIICKNGSAVRDAAQSALSN